MLSYLKRRYPDLRLVRMSDGRWSVIRDLGLVKGGKGLRCTNVCSRSGSMSGGYSFAAMRRISPRPFPRRGKWRRRR